MFCSINAFNLAFGVFKLYCSDCTLYCSACVPDGLLALKDRTVGAAQTQPNHSTILLQQAKIKYVRIYAEYLYQTVTQILVRTRRVEIGEFIAVVSLCQKTNCQCGLWNHFEFIS